MSETTPVDESGGSNGLNRRDLLVKAGVIGAGAVAAGSVAGAASAATKRVGATPKKGGKITFALEQDPVHIAPFGAILTSNHWGKEPMYESLIEWDAKLNQRPALAESWKVVDPRTIDFTLKRGVRFHNGKEVTAADVKYSVEGWLNPPLPGSATTVNQVPSIESAEVRSKYVGSSRGRATRRSCPRACTSRSTPAARGSARGRSASRASRRGRAPSTRRTRTTARRGSRT